MVEASPPPSAAQVFDAALRAEAEGNLDYAVQFYRHLSEHHGEAPEAIAARAALSRMAQPRPMASAARRPPALPTARPTSEGPPPSRTKPKRSPIRIAPAGDAEPRQPPVFPEPVHDYLSGRAIAHILSAAGLVVATLAGLVSLFHVFALGALLNIVGSASPLLAPLAGPIGLACGLAALFIGQLALALFDCANASRELVAFERAKAEHAQRDYR